MSTASKIALWLGRHGDDSAGTAATDSAGPAEPLDAPLAEAYRKFDQRLRVARTRVGYLLSLTLMPAGVTLDYFVYPELKWPMLHARIICDLAMLPCFLLTFTALGKRYIHLIDKPGAIFPAVAICWMIHSTQGVISPYYAGLNLILVVFCLVMPFRATEGAIFCGIIMVIYAITCLLYDAHLPGQRPAWFLSSLFNNLYFIVLTSIICVTACSQSSRRRFEDFSLRHELHTKNEQLQSTLKKLKETEVQLVQSEKMNALGKLSAGLLHEINNPLNFTFMALQCAEQEIEPGAPARETLRDIGEGMERIRCVVSDLRAFAYPATQANSESFSIEEALVTAGRLISHELGDLVIERQNFDGFRASGVKTQVVHVFMNTLVNSIQAVRAEKSGRAHHVTVACQQKDSRVFVKIRDNGVGVKPVNLPRLCEPFFTTKEVGQGTGLGLSICHTIVKNHGGELHIASEEGQWTEVTFDLPLAGAGSTS